MVPMARRLWWGVLAASGFIAVGLLPLSCGKPQRTGYVLDIHTGPHKTKSPTGSVFTALSRVGFA